MADYLDISSTLHINTENAFETYNTAIPIKMLKVSEIAKTEIVKWAMVARKQHVVVSFGRSIIFFKNFRLCHLLLKSTLLHHLI